MSRIKWLKKGPRLARFMRQTRRKTASNNYSTDDNYGRREDIRNSKFPPLINKNRTEYWETITGPVELDISNRQKSREGYSGFMKHKGTNQTLGPKYSRDSWADVVSKRPLEKTSRIGNNIKTSNNNTRNIPTKGRIYEQRWASRTCNRS